MKQLGKLLTGIACCAIISSTFLSGNAQAQVAERERERDKVHTYGGGAVGWSVAGPSAGTGTDFWLYTWAGIDTPVRGDNWKTIAAYQYVDNSRTSTQGGGGRLIVASRMYHFPAWILVGAGWLNDVGGKFVVDAEKGTRSMVEADAFTVDGGIDLPLADHVHLIGYAQAIDRRELGVDVILSASLAIVDLQDMLGLF